MRARMKSGPWLALGAALGTGIGVATDRLAPWLAAGVALGAALSAATCRRGN